MKKKLTLRNLHLLDNGLADKTFDHHMDKAVDDCYQRPEDKTARKVILTIMLKPDMKNGGFDGVDADIEFATVVPKMRTRVYRMDPIINRGKAEGLMFHPDLPLDPDGKTIMDVAGDETEETGKQAV